MKRITPYIIGLIVFVAAACIYCYPSLKGKVLHTGDDMTWRAAAQESMLYHYQTGKDIWWTGSMFSGMPTYQIGGGGTYRSERWLKPIRNITDKSVKNPVWQMLFYFVGFFILLLCFGVPVWLSIAGALAMGLSSYFIVIIAEGHNTKVATIALTAFVIGGFKLIFDKKYIPGCILVMIFVSSGFSKHPQMFYYFYMMLGLMWIAELCIHIKEKKYKEMAIATAIFVAATGIGIGTGMSNVFANAEYVSETTRGGSDLVKNTEEGTAAPSKGLDLSYATQFSYGIDETLSLMIPGFKGGSNKMRLSHGGVYEKGLKEKKINEDGLKTMTGNVSLYWGTQPFTAGNVYVGAVICFLFILGIFIVKGPYKWALLAATLFSFMLAWGSNFMWLTKIFFQYFPMYSKFRAVSSILVVAEVAMPLLGFMAVMEVIARKGDKSILKAIYASAAITGLICLFFALFGPSLYDFTGGKDEVLAQQLSDWYVDLLREQRAYLLRMDSLRSLGFILAAAALMWAYMKSKKMNMEAVALVLAVIVVADLWPVDRRYFNNSQFKVPEKALEDFDMESYEEAILKDPDPHFRVVNFSTNTYGDSRTSYRLKSVGGYSAAKLSRYQDLIDRYLIKRDLSILSMLNTKYIIAKDEEGTVRPYANTDNLGDAWFVESISFAKNANDELEKIGKTNLKRTAVVDKSFKKQIREPKPGISRNSRIVLTEYSPIALDYDYITDRDGIIVFSEIYYPHGWTATIDGKKADIFRANYLLRAMEVPSGRHSIHFAFDPESIKKGNTLAIVFIVLMYLICACGAGYGVYRILKKK